MVSRINPNKYEVMLRKTTIRSFANGQQEMYKLNAIWKDPQGKKLSDSAVNDLGIDSIMNGNMNCSVIKTVTTDYLVKNKWTLLSPDFGDCGCTSSDRRNTIDYNNIKRANKGLCCECNCRIITRDKKEYITGVIKEVLDDSIVNRIPFDVMIRTNKWLEIDYRKISVKGILESDIDKRSMLGAEHVGVTQGSIGVTH
jgi:hypothetical protein